MKYFSPAKLLHIALCTSLVGATITYVKRGQYTTVTAKGIKGPDGKFTPFTPDQLAEEDRKATSALMDTTGSTRKVASRDPSSSGRAESGGDTVVYPGSAQERRSVSAGPREKRDGMLRRLANMAKPEAGSSTAQKLKARQEEGAGLSSIFSGAGFAYLITLAAIAIAITAIVRISVWTEAREHFTKETTFNMMEKLGKNATAAALAPGAFCYNQGWDTDNWNHIGAKASKKLDAFPLHTTFDCAFLIAPVTVWTRGQGGYMNLAVTYDSNRCAFEHSSADFWCTH